MSITIDKDIRGGVPCITGTRFPISQLLSEIAEADRNLHAICEEFDIPIVAATKALLLLAESLNQPFDDWMDRDIRKALESSLPAEQIRKIDECHDNCVAGQRLMLNTMGEAIARIREYGQRGQHEA